MSKQLFLYSVFLLLFFLFSYLFIDTNLTYLHSLYTGFYSDYRIITTFVYFLLVSFFFLFYLYFLKKKITSELHKKLIVVSLLFLVFSYPAILSYDIFNYLATAKVLYFYKENPYLVMPIEFQGDPMLLFTRAANKFALYGFSWTALSGIPFVLGLQNFLAQLFLLKGMVGLFYLGLIYTLHKITKSLDTLLFFSLNPLVLVETFIGSHNDIVMMFFALSAFYFLKKKYILLAFVLLAVSIFVKFSTIFLLPIFIYVLYSYIKEKTINWNRIWFYSAILMFSVFLLAPLREEIYPWYAIWFLPFITLLKGFRKLKIVSVSLCFGLLLSYVPYMLLGHYLYPVPFLKIALVAFPVLCTFLYLQLAPYENNK